MFLFRIKQIFNIAFGLLSFMITLYALQKFVLFTSMPKQLSMDGNKQKINVAIKLMLKNMIWLVVFILQHSLQKHDLVKNFWRKIGFETIERSAYNLVSSLVLLVGNTFLSHGTVLKCN